ARAAPGSDPSARRGRPAAAQRHLLVRVRVLTMQRPLAQPEEAWHPSCVAADDGTTLAEGFGPLAGRWRGTNGFRLMPNDELSEAAATAELSLAAAGYDLVVTYTWVHPDDGPQEGVLLVGSPDDDGGVTAAWGDSWHQKPAILTLNGSLGERV